MKTEDTVLTFRIINKFRLINEHVECRTVLDQFIQAVNISEGKAKLAVSFAFYKYLEEKAGAELAEAVFAKLAEMGKVPSNLSTYEGFLQAFCAEMASGASFGGAMSGAGDNATINSTGMAGVDKPLKNNKIKKILSRAL